MKINNIDIRNLYSFGDSGTKHLSDFKHFNLFIGKNGSGKSNVFHAFKTIQLHIAYNPYSVHLPKNIFNKSIHKCQSPATAKQDRQNDRDLRIGLNEGEIVFQHSRHKSGDLIAFQDKVEIINASNSFEEFANKLRILSNHAEKEALLTFAFKYIFNKTVRIKDTSITEDYQLPEKGRHRTGNSVFYGESPSNVQKETSCQWSSGYIFVANLLTDILLLDSKEVICIDEPELHIEPRVLRRLIIFLFWLCLIQKNSRLDHELLFLKILDVQWNKWFEENKDMFRINDTDFSHSSYSSKQLFVCSHSASLINEYLSKPECCAIYEFDRTEEENKYHYPNNNDPKKEQVRYPIVSKVRRVAEFPHSILDNLGANGSDLLQANGIIWVEGPSDVIYLNKWLEMFAWENKSLTLRQGIDFEFQMYGGSLLDSICYINEKNEEINNEEPEIKKKKWEKIEKEEFGKLVSMFSFSRNAYVVMDSDAIKTDNCNIVDKSNYKNAKQFIKMQFESLSESNYTLGLWYNENVTSIRTIEDYLDDDTINSIPDLTKKRKAVRAVKSWGRNKKLSDFKHNLKQEIESLYRIIERWSSNRNINT